MASISMASKQYIRQVFHLGRLLCTSRTMQEETARRRSQLVDKAHERAANREAERQQLVKQLRDLQFRENCDAMRAKQSHQRQLNCIADQQEQVTFSLGMYHVLSIWLCLDFDGNGHV